MSPSRPRPRNPGRCPAPALVPAPARSRVTRSRRREPRPIRRTGPPPRRRLAEPEPRPRRGPQPRLAARARREPRSDPVPARSTRRPRAWSRRPGQGLHPRSAAAPRPAARCRGRPSFRFRLPSGSRARLRWTVRRSPNPTERARTWLRRALVVTGRLSRRFGRNGSGQGFRISLDGRDRQDLGHGFGHGRDCRLGLDRRLGRARRDRLDHRDGFRLLAELGSLGDDLGDQLLGLAAGGAVADGDDADMVLADQVLEVLLGLGAPVLGRVRVDHPLFEQVAVAVEHRDLAAGAEAGVDRQDDLRRDRRLEQQAAEVPGEDVDGVPLGQLGQVAADLALHAGQEQAVEGVDGRRRGRTRRGGAPPAAGDGRAPPSRSGRETVELDLQRPFLVASVDRQHAVGRDVRDRLGIVEVVAIFEPFALGDLGLVGDDLAGLPDHPADRVAHGGQLADRLGEDVAHPFEDLLDRVELLLGIERTPGPAALQVGQGLVAVPDPQGQRFEAPCRGPPTPWSSSWACREDRGLRAAWGYRPRGSPRRARR